MNTINTMIPNRIKQPAQCCVYCGKSYIKKTSLHKHVILCELLENSKKPDDEDLVDIPSQRKLYQMLLELGNRFNKLEKKMAENEKYVIKKNKKQNILEWLNENVIPEFKFDGLIDKIDVNKEDVVYLFKKENSFADTLNHIFARNLYKITDNELGYPIYACDEKVNIFYIYENNKEKEEENHWIELSRDKLVKFLDRVYMKLFRLYREYKMVNADKIKNDEAFSILCDKTCLKITKVVDFSKDAYLGKIKSNIFMKIKRQENLGP
jgi:hypothetical protein